MVSTTHQKHLTSHTIALILEAHTIATNSTGTRGNHYTTMSQVNPNVTNAKADTSSKSANILSRTNPNTS